MKHSLANPPLPRGALFRPDLRIMINLSYMSTECRNVRDKRHAGAVVTELTVTCVAQDKMPEHDRRARRLQQFSPPSMLKAAAEIGGSVKLNEVAFTSRSPPPPEATLTFPLPPPPPLQIGKTVANADTVATGIHYINLTNPIDPPIRVCWKHKPPVNFHATFQTVWQAKGKVL